MAEASFWERVNKTDGPNACWKWTSYHNSEGYGRFWHDGRYHQAHRIAWALTKGIIPEGMLICHHCDNPGCCNPAHLFLGTDADNARDRDAKGRAARHDGEANGRAKLCESQVLEIRRRYAHGGVLQRELGKEFGVDRSQIGYIVRGKSWANLTFPRKSRTCTTY